MFFKNPRLRQVFLALWIPVLTVLSACLFLLSLLAIFKAPAIGLWIPALIATEWGHRLALGCGLLWLATFVVPSKPVPRTTVEAASSTTSSHAKINALRRASSEPLQSVRVVLVLAGFLFLTPLIRAIPVDRHLSRDLYAAFPAKEAHQPLIGKPIRWSRLFWAPSWPLGAVQTVVYDSPHGKDLHMDIYAAAGEPRPRPLILIVHGGSWKGGDRSELSTMNRALAARGYVVATIDYRLAPADHFPAQRDDVFAAIRYLHAHAVQIGWNNKAFVLLGRSAGGQIALSAAYASKDPALRGVIAFYAPNDLVFGYSVPSNPWIMDSCRVIRDYIGATPDQRPDLYRDASPLFAASKRSVPTLTIHGGRDELVWPIHDERLSARLDALHRPHYYLNLPWGTHACDANLNGPSGQLSLYAMDYFLKWVF